MTFFKLNVLLITADIEEEDSYHEELESAERLGLLTKPAKPEALLPKVGTKWYNKDFFEVMSWVVLWDDQFDSTLVIAEIYNPKTETQEVINAMYTEAEWIDILKELGYKI